MEWCSRLIAGQCGVHGVRRSPQVGLGRLVADRDLIRDRSLEEVKGAAGANRLRREIQDQFNTQLFADGADTIQDVLFEEFVIQ